MKQIICILGIIGAIITSGCCVTRGVAAAPFDPNSPLLRDDLIEETSGGPVVAPTTIHTTNPTETNQHYSFGDENYIWDNWSEQ